ncbi:MAG: phosphotransferase [Ilumatobacteraceae bacterium]|nr:phosphotransferase [Ilumatobacteraceae bacterium]
MGEETESAPDAPPWLTADWLSTVLQRAVSIERVDRIGDGLVGMNLRVGLAGDVEPTSVVIKLPSPDPTSRASGIALRNYEREVKFYQRVADAVDIRVPRCFHAEWDESSGDFVLVMEDMSPAVQGDQLTGCDVDVAGNVIDELARLHGPRWDDDTLLAEDWLQRRVGDDDGAHLAGLWQMFFPGFEATYRRYLDDDEFELAVAFGPHVADWVNRRSGPWTVTHGDFRLDNMLFGDGDESPLVTTVDWQTPGHGVGVTDLSYFIGAGLLPADRREHERVLVERYAAAVEDYGVEIDRNWLWTTYRRDAFAGVVMAVVASQVVGESARSEAMFAAMATRHLRQALDLDALALV